MKKHEYEIEFEAATEEEAEMKMRALTTLAKKLSAKELDKMADILKNNPVKTALAKKALGV